MRKRIFIKASFVVLGMLAFTACKDDDATTDNTAGQLTYTAVQDNNRIQAEFDDLGNIIDDAVQDELQNQNRQGLRTKLSRISSCAEVTFAPAAQDTGTITIAFDGSRCGDFRRRSGTVTIQYNGRYRNEGSVITTTLSNYVVDSVAIEGTRTVTNTGLNSEGNLEFDVVVTGGKLTDDDETITWESTRLREWIANDTLDFADDQYRVSGEASGVDREGRRFTMTILENQALLWDGQCWKDSGYINRLPVEGIQTIEPEGLTPRIVDFGQGECDRNVTVTVGIITINLPL